MATSARFMTVNTSLPWAGDNAIPALAWMLNRMSPTWKAAVSAVSMPVAISSARAEDETSPMSTANSSPPSRATVAWSGRLASRRRATSISSSSPTWWPRVSLISLK